MSDKKLYLLDAFALIFRSYYALIRSPRITSKGRNTNAQFGFTNALIDLIKKENPSHLSVVFDTSAPTERHVEYEAYKANRQETPEDILSAVPDIKRLIKAFNIPVMEYDGYEADDLIGTLAHQASDRGYEVYMVTPDKDYGQLVRDNVYMYKPGYQGGKPEKLGPEAICEKWNIARVDQVVDMLGLMGDAVDNIPGIAGVGEKTAAKLLAQYDTLEGILEHADEIKGKLGEKVRAGKENAILSKKLATIITDVPVEFHEEDFKMSEWNKEELTEIFAELEFKTLGKRILGESFTTEEQAPVATAVDLFGNPIAGGAVIPKKETPENKIVEEPIEDTLIKNIENTAHNYQLINTDEQIKELVIQLSAQKEIAFDTETTGIDPHQADIIGMSFSWEQGSAYYVPLSINREEAKTTLALFDSLFEKEDILWIGQNIKYDMTILKWYGITLKGKTFDTMLAHYVIEPEGKHSMDVLSEKYLHYQPVSIETLIGKKGKNQKSMAELPVEEVTDYAAEDADVTLQLKQKFEPLLDEKEVRKIFAEVENPLVPILLDMEYEGISVDQEFLNAYSKELEADIKQAEESVYEQAGVRFNLSSPKQLGEVLFDKMKLDDKAKKTKSGQYATSEDILQKLRTKHTIVDNILVFRELSKLKSTYVDALPNMINPRTGRVHTNFSQAVAVTGRLSSVNPNLQNIPIKTDKGREVRKAFVPRGEDWQLLSADYSQIELRIVAAISNDVEMIKAFVDNKDIHTATAAKVYKVAEDEVTSEMRRAAKAVNFGIIYGQTAFGLASSLDISRTEAKTIIDNYFLEYPSIKKYMDDTVATAKDLGYVTTLMGRKRYLRDINSSNHTVRGYAERNAINSPIQGTAAEMIKMAMTKVYYAMQQQNLKSKMILQVHDELVFDVHRDEIELMKKIVKENMESAMELPNNVPLNTEVGIGNNWLEAH
ncbi:MAG: DNA polymerase I [Flavipsychrobacter sp.]